MENVFIDGPIQPRDPIGNGFKPLELKRTEDVLGMFEFIVRGLTIATTSPECQLCADALADRARPLSVSEPTRWHFLGERTPRRVTLSFNQIPLVLGLLSLLVKLTIANSS